MFKFIVVFVMLLNSAIASPKIGIITIFDQFVISNAIASRCEKLDEETLIKFTANFEMIAMRTQMKLEEKYPTATKDKIKKVMLKGIEEITSKAKKMVDEKGCNNIEIQEAIKRFYVQAKWKPYQQK